MEEAEGMEDSKETKPSKLTGSQKLRQHAQGLHRYLWGPRAERRSVHMFSSLNQKLSPVLNHPQMKIEFSLGISHEGNKLLL